MEAQRSALASGRGQHSFTPLLPSSLQAVSEINPRFTTSDLSYLLQLEGVQPQVVLRCACSASAAPSHAPPRAHSDKLPLRPASAEQLRSHRGLVAGLLLSTLLDQLPELQVPPTRDRSVHQHPPIRP